MNKLDSKGDSIQFENDTLSLKSGDKVLSTTRIKDETKDYESLLNIPTLNNIEIKGNKTANDYNIGNGLKVDEAKVTYKGEEISFKDFITQYLKDNEAFAKLIENKAKKFDVNSPLSKEIGNGENVDILKLKDKSIDKQFLAQSIVDILENIENIDFADYSQYSTEDNFYDLSQLDENKTIFVNKAGYVGIANSILYDWQAEEPTQKQNNVIYVNTNSFITVNKGENGYKSIYFITDKNQYYFEKITSNDNWKLYRTNLNAVYQTWQFSEQLDKTKQDNLISGDNIKIENNIISATSEFQKLDLTEDINLSTLETGAYQVTVEGYVTTPRKDRHWVSKDGLIFIESRPYGYFDCFIADSSPKLISYIDSELKVTELKYLYDYIPITEFIFGFIEETLPNEYAKKTEIPTKTSQLENDSGFLTEHQDISHLQERLSDEQLSNIADIPNKVSADYVNTAIQTAITDVLGGAS